MLVISGWLRAEWLGLPHWGWLLLVAFGIIETLLGRSKDPRWRSVADSIRNALGLILPPVLGRLPGIGPIILTVLRTLLLIPDAVSGTSQTKIADKPE